MGVCGTGSLTTDAGRYPTRGLRKPGRESGPARSFSLIMTSNDRTLTDAPPADNRLATQRRFDDPRWDDEQTALADHEEADG